MTKTELRAYRLDWISTLEGSLADDAGCTLHLSPEEAMACVKAHSGPDRGGVYDFPLGYVLGEVTLFPITVGFNSELGKGLRERNRAIQQKQALGRDPYQYFAFDPNPARTVVISDPAEIAELVSAGDPIKVTLDADRQYVEYASDMSLEALETVRLRKIGSVTRPAHAGAVASTSRPDKAEQMVLV